jgi:hypothetical protein
MLLKSALGAQFILRMGGATIQEPSQISLTSNARTSNDNQINAVRPCQLFRDHCCSARSTCSDRDKVYVPNRAGNRFVVFGEHLKIRVPLSGTLTCIAEILLAAM